MWDNSVCRAMCGHPAAHIKGEGADRHSVPFSCEETMKMTDPLCPDCGERRELFIWRSWQRNRVGRNYWRRMCLGCADAKNAAICGSAEWTREGE